MYYTFKRHDLSSWVNTATLLNVTKIDKSRDIARSGQLHFSALKAKRSPCFSPLDFVLWCGHSCRQYLLSVHCALRVHFPALKPKTRRVLWSGMELRLFCGVVILADSTYLQCIAR